ncbi:MAG: type II toxin-antitoxin system VapC family toxin [Burkholderiales bacterium]|jgi:predicted nucleic acid-binding protein
MIVLDTNVVSEFLRPEPIRQVERWLSAQDGSKLYFTTVSEAELRHGVSILPAGKRRTMLSNAIEGLLEEDFRDRILPFDRPAARAYATIAAARRAAGRPISQFDCQIAAIARACGATVATRNTSDYEGCGIELIDPWKVSARQ